MKGLIMGIFTTLFGLTASQTTFADTKDMIILDVRTAAEYQDAHVQSSLNIDILDSSFQGKINTLDKNKTYKVYCRSGNRSGQAEKLMKSLGFKDVENIGSLSQAVKRLNSTCEGKNC